MLGKIIVHVAVTSWVCFATTIFAQDKGPESVILKSTIDTEKVSKPAYLPHHVHQWLECDGCHHVEDASGKKVEWTPGQKIEKCETCHNSKSSMPEHINTLKKAGHALCMDCHLKQDAALTKCGVCHTEKK